jgi:hypothetical protein
MNTLTEQEVFDTVINHLRAQGHQATDKDSCVYRSLSGDKCAAGSLIQDDEYQPWMENHLIIKVLKDDRCPTSLQQRLTPHLPLITELQRIHDRNEDVNEWEIRWARTATDYKLAYRSP